MSGVRIKNLESASEVIEKFDEFEFVVDSPDPDSTLKLSGKDLKKVVAAVKHTHAIQEVEHLPEELDKKLDKAGGTITGDLHVRGDAHFKNLRVDEYLEVPELKYNRITATGNEFWVTDAGVVDEVSADAEGVYTVQLKEKEGEHTINFAYKDILRGIFYTQDENGNPTGFRTAYFEVTGIASPTTFTCISLNGIAPARFMTLARQGNKSNTARQGSIYMDGLHKYIRVIDGVKDGTIDLKNIKVQLGDLSEINHPIFGQLKGYGALLENAYVCGRLVQKNPTTGEEWAVGAVSVQGEQVIRYNADGTPENASVTLTATEHGIASTSTDRRWQYKSGADWVDIPSANGLSYTLIHNATFWNGRNTLTLRYVAFDLYDDTITITKIGDGRPGADGKDGTPGAPGQKGEPGPPGPQGEGIENLQIGGVNLFYGSDTGRGWSYSNMPEARTFALTRASTGETGYIYSPYIVLKGNAVVTLSFESKEDSSITSRDLFVLPDNYPAYGLWSTGFPMSQTWRKNVFTFTTPAGWGDGLPVRLRIDHNGSYGGVSATIYARNIKIEYGNVATEWSPSPDDFHAAIAEAAKAVTFRGEFSPYTPYYNTTNRKDCVRYGGNYYLYKGPNATSSWWNDSYWESFGGQYESLATGIFLAELAYIENLGVKNLRTNTSGQRVEITQNNNALAFYDGVQSYPVVEIKTTSDGIFLGQGSGILVRHPQSDITINNGILQRSSEGSGVSVPVLPWSQPETIAQNCILQSYNNSYTGKYKTGIYVDISASQSTASGTDKFTALFANGGGIFLQGGASAFRSNNVFCGVTCAGRVNSSGTLLNSWVITFMGGYLSSSRFAEGRYRIYFSNTGYFVSGSEYQVLLLPDGLNDQSTGAYGTVSARYTSYFDVWMADDASPNNTGFTFIVFLLSKFW